MTTSISKEMFENANVHCLRHHDSEFKLGTDNRYGCVECLKSEEKSND